MERISTMPVTERIARTLVAVALVAACSSMAPQALYSAMSSSEEAVIVTDKGNNGQLRVAKGGTLVIRLEAIPGTGYGWQVVKSDAELLKPVGTPVFEQSEKDLVGAPEQQVFRFKAQAAGSVEVELHYVRPWEKDVPPAKIYRITVRID
jgi:inhibitor of cysteine peptidase